MAVTNESIIEKTHSVKIGTLVQRKIILDREGNE
jgi:hypothetical protein